MYNWSPTRGYKGNRTNYRQAVRVRLKPRDTLYDRQIFYQGAQERLDWCEENCKSSWSYVDGCYWFDNTREAVMFKMVFGGQ